MLKEETSDGSGDGCNDWARLCDACRSAACSVYCRVDAAYLCADCDARIHAANKLASRHERVWVCEACERAPAAFLCKADAASLCASCDADIHSANPLARRHQRIPILPVSGSLYGPPARDQGGLELKGAPEDEDEAASWLVLHPAGKYSTNQNTGVLFAGETDQYNSSGENQYNNQYQEQQQQYRKNYGGGDSVVPVQYGDVMNHFQQQQYQEYQFGVDCGSSKALYSYNYNGSIRNSASISSLDGGVVPETVMSDFSISFTQPQMPPQLTPMDREARVLRYREKRKTRKFEKTIRYASRKAYAETRPRIKGRFVKRSEVEVEANQMFSTFMPETVYGVVPSF